MIYLDPQELEDAFIDDNKEAKQLWLPFDEYERLAANKVRADKPANYPSVNDGTLAAYLLELPMRVLAQLQTGKAKAIDSDETWLSELATIIWANMIVPHANTQAPFLSKQQTALYRAAEYGSCPLFAFFSVRDGYTGADFMVPYIKDVVWERRKHSDMDCDRAWLTTYYSDTQIKNMIARASKDKTGENKWNAKVLQELLDAGPEERDNQTKNKNERDTSVATGGYRLITCFQRGTDAPFYTVAPNIGYKLARETSNVNPTGDMPLINLYCYENLENPLGKGLVELGRPLQNVLDFITQAHMFATQIGLEPPIELGGDLSQLVESSIVFRPSKKWRIGNATVNLKDTATRIYQAMPEVYGLYKTQLMNVLGYNDATVSADAGNPTYSKTPAGIQQGQSRASAHDNFYRKRCDEAFGRLAKIMLNLHKANMEGQGVVKLFENDIIKLRAAGLPNMPEDDNKLEVEWDDLRSKFDFYVDEGSSKGQDDDDQMQKVQQLITDVSGNPVISWYLGQDGSQLHIGEAYKQLFTYMGIKNIDRIITPLPPDQKQAAAQSPFPVMDKPKVTIAFDDLPPSAQLGALRDAGISITPDTAGELQIMKQAKIGKDVPQPSTDQNQHPIARMMESLQIKWTDLPEDVQQQLIPILFGGIQSTMPSPVAITQDQKQQDLNIKAAAQQENAHTNAQKTALEVVRTAHEHTMAIHNATKPPEPKKELANAA
jgi:hypothetical protein